MKDKAKVLILSSNFGSGHKVVTEAITRILNEENKDIEIRIVDYLEITNPNSYSKIYNNYDKLVNYGSGFYNVFYYGKEKFDIIKKIDTISNKSVERIKVLIEDEQPNIIISTFSIASGFVSRYKREYNSNIPLITVITDVLGTNEWIYPETDYYCISTKEIKDYLIDKGIEEERLLITGIPLRKEFYNEPKEYSLDILKTIPKDKKVVTLLGGGLGLMPDNVKYYKKLSEFEKIHFIVVTGNNQKLYNKLKTLITSDNITIMGYTEKIYEILSRSDFAISKAGGITLFELIMYQVPCLIYKPKLGQEKENCKFIGQTNIGYIVENEKDMIKYLREVVDHPEIIDGYKSNLKKIKDKVNINKLTEIINSLL